MQHLCLIVERDADVAQRLQRELPPLGFKPYLVDSFHSASVLLQQWTFDVVLLDMDGFGENHLEALRQLHRRSRSPIVLLTRVMSEVAQLAGLEAGASDTFVLPASTRLLAAKLRRLIEASARSDDEPDEISVGPLTMNARRGTSQIEGKPLVLTAHQFDLLYLLAIRLGQFVHREAIGRALRSSAADAGRSADVHVYRIRKKLRAMGVVSLRLDTVHGRGYCLSLDAPVQIDDLEDVDSLVVAPARDRARHSTA